MLFKALKQPLFIYYFVNLLFIKRYVPKKIKAKTVTIIISSSVVPIMSLQFKRTYILLGILQCINFDGK
mgnify:CR=1 FL=1